ncbi:MAG: glutamate-5-semialdehyde dehydrogenase [Bacteroidetes bacterium]|nr:glutamate-5-semialdehyde dehydrogenase [Bacteroidota bacterium]MBU1373322.1 glutamate-5-semialdehyde dehydrogenase [Bacteroidota bacterium]MBU1484413.1 glutamate-5-semialdehyde dehydrogenase [Bacteroidota bacterium]MBU1760213.1 glutamate-5-semialdehyde dehydrogenase [Bacteroidota bacterium]MBU2268677.1 glutamate-5-semialdehyde dehydrogenase [Bacteroidota bacterium]
MENINHILKSASLATTAISSLTADVKQQVLEKLAQELEFHLDEIIVENKKDLDKMPDTDPKKDRLLLNEERIQALAQSVREVAVLKDPTNQILVEKTLSNGLFLQKKTVALGVVGVIYEARPNVTVDVAALCIRSGNVCVLRGGSDADATNQCLVNIIQNALKYFDLNPAIVQLLPVDRKFVEELLSADKYIDIIIPRGSQSLIDFVRKNAKVPVIETGAGVCHTYVESSGNLEKAAKIICNAKVSRPSVCNALDTVIMDEAISLDLIPQMANLLKDYEVEIFADEKAYPILKEINYPFLNKAETEDFGREFLSLKCSVKVVTGIDEALAHIKQFSSKHSEAIICEDAEKIERFLNQVDAAAVYANASTRFTDGGVFGLGAEIGISTQKLHARGPFALEKLVTEKWVVWGNGQVR